VKVHLHTFGCKANQYDTERIRQEVEARGAEAVDGWGVADVCVVNTCTVTNQADAQARRLVRRVHRENPGARVVVVGCSAALNAPDYRAMDGVASVVEGHDPLRVAGAILPVPPASARVHDPSTQSKHMAAGRESSGGLVQLELRAALDRVDTEPVGAELLQRRAGATRGWLKIQDGCDRKCSFCATRLARGGSRSRPPAEIVAEARALAERHPELVLTGIHIGHYGRDLDDDGRPRAPGARRIRGDAWSLSRLLARLLDEIPDVRFRLGSVEATEIDDLLLELLATSGGRVAPHLHMPLQSGADQVLRAMRRWHTREQYRARAVEIAGRMPRLGLGADVITGFPGETEEDHASTRALVEELPFTYLHVFPFSPRNGTVAAELVRRDPVPQRVAGERSRELRELVRDKAVRYRRQRVGGFAEITLERERTVGLTGDYLRVDVRGAPAPSGSKRLHRGVLHRTGEDLYIDLSRQSHDG
jgi:threonylcarbamoyladenosine tRNA methylthiotransferase MtaB